MKRVIASALVLALVLTIALPAVALAKRGGVPASPNGKGAAAAPGAKDEAPAAERGGGKGPSTAPGQIGRDADASAEGTATDSADETARPGNGQGRSSKPRGAETAEQARVRTRSEDGSGTPEPKRTGIANALDRLERNLERMKAELEAGTRSSLPPGLQRAIAKFMSWLGIGEEYPVDTPPDDDGPSGEPTGTVEPTATVEPTGTVEPTATLEADAIS